MNPCGVAMCVIGLMVLVGALSDADWLMDTSRARFISNLLTPMGARIFYIIIALIALLLGASMLFGPGSEAQPAP